MARTIEKIEYDLEHYRRERLAWKHTRGGEHKYEMASMMVASLEKELSEAINNQGNDDRKTPDSI